jgi:hypothetical protein
MSSAVGPRPGSEASGAFLAANGERAGSAIEHGRTAGASVLGAGCPGRLGRTRYPVILSRLDDAVTGGGQPFRALLQLLSGARHGGVITIRVSQAQAIELEAGTGHGIDDLPDKRDQGREVALIERPGPRCGQAARKPAAASPICRAAT